MYVGGSYFSRCQSPSRGPGRQPTGLRTRKLKPEDKTADLQKPTPSAPGTPPRPSTAALADRSKPCGGVASGESMEALQ